jgi:hypothetical protein
MPSRPLRRAKSSARTSRDPDQSRRRQRRAGAASNPLPYRENTRANPRSTRTKGLAHPQIAFQIRVLRFDYATPPSSGKVSAQQGNRRGFGSTDQGIAGELPQSTGLPEFPGNLHTQRPDRGPIDSSASTRSDVKVVSPGYLDHWLTLFPGAAQLPAGADDDPLISPVRPGSTPSSPAEMRAD